MAFFSKTNCGIASISPANRPFRMGSSQEIMKSMVFLCGLLVCGCAAPRVAYLSDSEVKQAFASAPAHASEPGHEELRPWLNLKTEVRREFGRWLPGRPPSILVTVDVLNSSHCAGFFHQMLAVVDPQTGRLATPVYHVTADEASRRLLSSASQDVIVFSACRQQMGDYRRDCSVVLRFTVGDVQAEHPLGQRDPERFMFLMSRDRGSFRIRKRDNAKVADDIVLRWNSRTGELESQKDG